MIAFKQANSAGFTPNFLNLMKTSFNCFKNAVALVDSTSVSEMVKIGDLSYGRDH